MHPTQTPTIARNSTAGSRPSLPPETRTLLRTLGTLAITLADNGTTDAGWLRDQIAGLPTDPGPGTRRNSDLLTIPETCARLRLSRWSVYQLINRHELASVKIGRRRLVPAADADRFVRQLVGTGGRS
ncbi:helix-turn-helix domain-containing protein [Nocardia colli]|uniref:helix-turn-helix domain-containing protein n=1 Tax=Nocardia colli TaxID=2545717 RepID=UPI0035DDEF2B